MKASHSVLILWLLSSAAAAGTAEIAAQPAPLPIFLRAGFSSVLEFDDSPQQVVIGDGQAFQVERLDRSLVLRAILPYATSNLFVYFKDGPPKLFILTASEDANPTYFKRIENPKLAPPPRLPETAVRGAGQRSSRVVAAKLDPKKDYLTVEVLLVADSGAMLRPKWDLVRLRFDSKTQAPFKLWSERKEVQKDSAVRARFIFVKPNVPKTLTNVALILPIEGSQSPLVLALHGGQR